MTVRGDPGMGKTSLLDELRSRATDFQVLAADGLESERIPFSVLAQWGVDLPALDDVGNPFVAAQALRQRLDRLAKAGPVLLLLDDLHWADPESIESVIWLLRRAAGDRVLVAVGTRPLPATLHAGWQRWVAGHDRGTTVDLAGLSTAEVARLVEQLRPGVPREAAQRLHEHTSGNPLYLTALLNEFGVTDLLRMRALPAPTEFAQVLAARVARLSPEGVALLRAVAVLGNGWASLPDTAAVAGSESAGAAVEELDSSGLLQVRALQSTTSLRFTHALMRAAVYQQTPLLERRRLHERAATVVVSRSAVLEHRIAAAEQYDDHLATSIQAYAQELYQQHSFRLAAEHLRWSSILTAEPRLRERRWLESHFYSVMALDVELVHREADEIAAAGDHVLRALVLGALAVWERRFDDGIAVLEPVEQALPPATDRVTRYRMEVLLGWARVCSDREIEKVRDALARAADSRVADAGLDGSELVTAGGTEIRTRGFRQALAGEWAAPLPDRVAATPLHLTKQLIWRGAIRTRLGFFDEAIADLTEGTRRIQNGVTDFGRGAFHAFLASAQWMRGDWDSARLTARLALDFSGPFSHPMVLAMTALPAIGYGQFDEVDELLGRAQAILARAPWWEARQLLMVSRVARLHAQGSAAARSALLSQERAAGRSFPTLVNTNPLLRLHLGLAALWSGDPDDAAMCADSLDEVDLAAPWRSGAALWLRGLIAEHRGSAGRAGAHFDAAISHGADNLPLYHAHLLTDHARVALVLGRPIASRQSLEQAHQIYARLGATPYLDRMATLRAVSSPAKHSAVPTVTLTDREHDVMTLVAAGLSYAQVSRELFITQSTVSYHLGNMYAKAGVRSRHELIDLFRREPAAFAYTASSA